MTIDKKQGDQNLILKSCNNLSQLDTAAAAAAKTNIPISWSFSLCLTFAPTRRYQPADKLINAQNRLQRERMRGCVGGCVCERAQKWLGAHPSSSSGGVLAVVIVTHFRLRLGVDYINDSRQLNWRVVSKLD